MNRLFFLLLLFSITFLTGCGGPTADPPPDPQASISTLGRVYGQFALQNKRGPKDEGEFKAFLNSFNEKQREAMGMTNVDAAFTSPRDNQPYTVKYGLQGSSGGEKKPEWRSVIEEKTGKDGVRYGASETGTVTDLSKAAVGS